MFRINRTTIESETTKRNAKTNKGANVPTLFEALKLKFWNLYDAISNFPAYEMAHWITNTDRWLHNRKYINTIKYKRSTIVFVDLGATNFRFEPSFVHPCVVLVNRKDRILVVPCSSKKYGTGYPDIIDATKSDGFLKDTGVQMESLRWIHKNRVISILGTAKPSLMDKIDDYLLNLIPTSRKRSAILNSALNELNEKQRKIEEIQKELEEKHKEIEHMTVTLERFRKKILKEKEENRRGHAAIEYLKLIEKELKERGYSEEFKDLFSKEDFTELIS